MNLRELKHAHKRTQRRLRQEEDLVDAILGRLSLYVYQDKKNGLTKEQVLALDSICDLGNYKDLWV
jgi:hypothetical protein